MKKIIKDGNKNTLKICKVVAIILSISLSFITIGKAHAKESNFTNYNSFLSSKGSFFVIAKNNLGIEKKNKSGVIKHSGNWGDCYYEIDSEGNCRIFGSGKVGELYSFRDSIKKVIIEEGVTSIGFGAFSDCKRFTEITIPESVTYIGYGAFAGCSGLKKITIPESVTSISEYTFGKCSGLEEITIPESVTSIYDEAFEGCSRLEEIKIPRSVIYIGENILKECSGLKKLTISFTYDRVSWDCDNLEELVLTPETKDGIYYYPSYKRPSNTWPLKKITLENGIKKIYSSDFKGYSNLTEIIIPESVTSIGDGAFEGCSRLEKITIPESVTSIGSGAFSGCSGLKEIKIPKSVTSIDGSVFKGCSGLKEMIIPESVTSIGKYAYEGCIGLTKLVIPESVKAIDVNAFKDDISLVLYVDKGSYAEQFARANNMSYNLINDGDSTSKQPTNKKKKVSQPGKKIGNINNLKLKNKKKRKMIVSWTRARGAKKYQIKYAYNKKFKKAKTKTIAKTKITIKKIKKKKTYYVKVRGISGAIFGKWSSTKKIKIRK